MSIYDDLANSDFVNPGQFKEQMKRLGQLQDTEDATNPTSGEGNQLQAQEISHQAVLPGRMYAENTQDPTRASSEEFKMRMMNLESLKRQNLIQE